MTKVELDGEEYELRRLGLSDIFVLNDVIASVYAGAKIRGTDLARLASTAAGSADLLEVVLLGLPFAEEDIKNWLLSMAVGYEKEDIFLPDVMNLVDALSGHPDIASFLDRGKKMLPVILKKVLKKQESETQDA